jgi:hypothetical protein
MLFSFGVNIANERSQRMNILMRATPLPASIYLLAKALSALLSALVMLLILSGFAIVVGGVQLSVTTWSALIASLVLGVLPFILLGFAIGLVINPTGATPIVNLSFFILAFASGVFVPLLQLPQVVQNLAPYSPFYRLAQLACSSTASTCWSLLSRASPMVSRVQKGTMITIGNILCAAGRSARFSCACRRPSSVSGTTQPTSCAKKRCNRPARRRPRPNATASRAQELHGRVEVSSQPGQGTTVLISIPLLEALRSPAEEARQRYELARRGYQLCANASFLGTAMGLVGIVTLNHAWGIAVLGGLLVAIYGYASGVYYRTRVALSAGRGSRAALELAQRQYRVGLDLMRLTSVGALYALNLARFLHFSTGRWLLVGTFACLVGLIQFSRWRYYRDTERYYGVLSTQELGWELERRRQTLVRSLTLWFVASAAGLISAHPVRAASADPCTTECLWYSDTTAFDRDWHLF